MCEVIHQRDLPGPYTDCSLNHTTDPSAEPSDSNRPPEPRAGLRGQSMQYDFSAQTRAGARRGSGRPFVVVAVRGDMPTGSVTIDLIPVPPIPGSGPPEECQARESSDTQATGISPDWRCDSADTDRCEARSARHEDAESVRRGPGASISPEGGAGRDRRHPPRRSKEPPDLANQDQSPRSYDRSDAAGRPVRRVLGVSHGDSRQTVQFEPS